MCSRVALRLARIMNTHTHTHTHDKPHGKFMCDVCCAVLCVFVCFRVRWLSNSQVCVSIENYIVDSVNQLKCFALTGSRGSQNASRIDASRSRSDTLHQWHPAAVELYTYIGTLHTISETNQTPSSSSDDDYSRRVRHVCNHLSSFFWVIFACLFG